MPNDHPVQPPARAGLFLAVCTATGAALLLAAVVARFFTAHNYQDFAQFYMGGLVARHGAWADLYPIPMSPDRNPGDPETSLMKPEYARLAAQAGVPDSLRFIQVPPLALACAPLSLLPFKAAHLVWTLASVTLGVVVAWQAGVVFARLADGGTYLQGAVVFLVAASPNMYQACRMGQLSTLIGAGFGLAMLGLASRERSGLVAGFGWDLASIKFAGGVLAPLLLAMRRWRTIGCAAALAAGFTAVSLAFTGFEPWVTWWADIAPTLSRSHPWAANQSLHGLAMRVWDSDPPRAVAIAIRVAGGATLLGVMLLIFTRPRRAWANPCMVFAASGVLLAWLHIFSPIFWSHYYPYLFPLWGWLAWEATRSRGVALPVAVVFTLAWAPAGIIPSIGNRLPEPARTHMLGSAVLLLAISVWRLTRPAQGTAPASCGSGTERQAWGLGSISTATESVDRTSL